LFTDIAAQRSSSYGERTIARFSFKAIIITVGLIGGVFGGLLAGLIPADVAVWFGILVGFIYVLRLLFKAAFHPLDKSLKRYIQQKSELHEVESAEYQSSNRTERANPDA